MTPERKTELKQKLQKILDRITRDFEVVLRRRERKPEFGIRSVSAEEIAAHPTKSLLARDYIKGEESGEPGEAD